MISPPIFYFLAVLIKLQITALDWSATGERAPILLTRRRELYTEFYDC